MLFQIQRLYILIWLFRIKWRKGTDCSSWITGFLFRGFKIRGGICAIIDKQRICCGAIDSDWRSAASFVNIKTHSRSQCSSKKLGHCNTPLSMMLYRLPVTTLSPVPWNYGYSIGHAPPLSSTFRTVGLHVTSWPPYCKWMTITKVLLASFVCHPIWPARIGWIYWI